MDLAAHHQEFGFERPSHAASYDFYTALHFTPERLWPLYFGGSTWNGAADDL
jgi:hypothetical protein